MQAQLQWVCRSRANSVPIVLREGADRHALSPEGLFQHFSGVFAHSPLICEALAPLDELAMVWAGLVHGKAEAEAYNSINARLWPAVRHHDYIGTRCAATGQSAHVTGSNCM